MRVLYIILTLSIIAGSAKGQALKYSNEFLSLGVSARAAGMSNAVVATVEDATAGYWNPAGLVRLKDNLQISLMHSQYFAGIANYDYGALGFKLNDKSSMGFSFIRFGIDDIPNTLDLVQNGQIDYSRIKTFSAIDYAFLGTYASKTKVEGLNVGGSVKVVHRKVGTFAKAWGFGIDLGAQFTKNNWNFGVQGRDITSTFNAWSYTFTEAERSVLQATNNEIPKNSLEITAPKLIIGGGRKFNVYKKFTILPELDADLTFDGKRNVLIKSKVFNFDPKLGFEAGYNELVFLRAGVGNIQKETDFDGVKRTTVQPNIGVGFKYKGVALDYALSDIGDQSASLYSNVFSVRLAFNKGASE